MRRNETNVISRGNRKPDNWLGCLFRLNQRAKAGGFLREAFVYRAVVIGYALVMNSNHEPLQVLVFAKLLSDEIYALTSQPSFRRFSSLKSQLERAALSVTSNIAEGDGRPTTKDSVRFFSIAVASAAETKIQLELASKIRAIPHEKAVSLHEGYSKVCRMLNKLSEVRLNRIK
jgi:four helix bundle protein